MSALHLAAQAGSLPLLDLLLASGAEGVNARTKEGVDPLMLAAAGGHGRAMELLLRAGAQPKHKGGDGRTALHLAAENGHAAAVQLLAAGGSAKLGCRGKDGMTPLMLAVAGGHAAARPCWRPHVMKPAGAGRPHGPAHGPGGGAAGTGAAAAGCGGPGQLPQPRGADPAHGGRRQRRRGPAQGPAQRTPPACTSSPATAGWQRTQRLRLGMRTPCSCWPPRGSA